jgi:putative hydrolase of the HAD superfamily
MRQRNTLFEDIEAVLFDLDETLIDAEAGLREAHDRISETLSTFFEQNGVQMGVNLLRSKIKLFDDRMNRESRYDRDEWWPILISKVRSDLIVSQGFARALTIEYWNAYSQYSPPYSDAITTLNHLRRRGYKLGLVTDTDGTPGLKAQRINKLSFRDFFSVVIVAGEDTPELKPNPTPFLKASERLGITNQSSVFVGDKPFTDIAGAKAAGMKTIHVQRREWNSNVEADVTIESLTDLVGIL